MSNLARNDEKNQQEMAVFGGKGSSAAVFSKLVLIYTYESHHTQGEPWNFLMKAVASTFQEKSHSPPPFQSALILMDVIVLVQKYIV